MDVLLPALSLRCWFREFGLEIGLVFLLAAAAGSPAAGLGENMLVSDGVRGVNRVGEEIGQAPDFETVVEHLRANANGASHQKDAPLLAGHT